MNALFLLMCRHKFSRCIFSSSQIDVNPDSPIEKNTLEGVLVQPFVNHKAVVKGVEHEAVDGYRIECPHVDVRDIQQDRFAAWLLSHHNSDYVVVRLPIFGESFFADKATVGYLKCDVSRTTEKNGMKKESNKDRRFKYVMIKCPELLTNSTFSPDTEDGKINMVVSGFTSNKITLQDRWGNDKIVSIPQFNVLWHVTKMTEEARLLVQPKAAVNDGAAALKAAFDGMSV